MQNWTDSGSGRRLQSRKDLTNALSPRGLSFSLLTFLLALPRSSVSPQAIAKAYPGQFRLDYALSREQNNRKGGKMYIQVRGRFCESRRAPQNNNQGLLSLDGLRGGLQRTG